MNGRNVRIGGLRLLVVPVGAVAIGDLVSPIACWLAWLEVGRRSSHHTMSAYRRDLWTFLSLSHYAPARRLLWG